MYSTPYGHPPWPANTPYTPLGGQNAYIPVPARHTFGPPSVLPPPPTYVPTPLSSQHNPPAPPTTAALPPASEKKKIEWPPAVREYVGRCFAPSAAIIGITSEQITLKLKEIITEAKTSGRLETLDWANLPLPQQMLQEERNRALLTHVNSSSHISHAPTQSFVDPPQPHLDGFRKRKSTEMLEEVDSSTSQAPWRTKTNPSGSLADRVSFATSGKKPKLDMSKSVSKSNASLDARRKRFDLDSRGGSHSPQTQESSRAASPDLRSTAPIVGRSQKLEKSYLRLTSAPNPDNVRPLEVLRKTLDLLKKKWRNDASYSYICDQFKSLRQDLTVQHIKNEFTTSVYEYHARIALEKGDLGEYNQCQTQLRALYQQGLGGHPVEFKAYRILYFIHTCNRTDMNDVLSELTPADKKEPAIKHALDVRSALALGNYHKFFQLYHSVPDMGAYLMDIFVERERLAALAALCKSYKPDVRLRFVTEELGFESDEETCQFILNHAPEDSNLLEERESHVRFLTGKVGSVFEAAKAAAFGAVDIKGQI